MILRHPEAVVCVMFAGQVSVGFCISLTVTGKLQEPVLPAASVAMQVTVVMPFGNAEPELGEQVTLPTPEQLSLAVGVVKVTTA